MSESKKNDFSKYYTDLLSSIKAGRLIPVLGGDINLCGRPRQDDIPIAWEATQGKYPPTTYELALFLLNKAIQENHPQLSRVLSSMLGTQNGQQNDVSDICLANVCQYIKLIDRRIITSELPCLLQKDYQPTPVHDFLVKLAQYQPDSDVAKIRPYPCIVTTCLDRVLEQQFDKNKIPYHLVAYLRDEESGRRDDQSGRLEYTSPDGKSSILNKTEKDQENKLMEGFKDHPVIFKLNGGIKMKVDEPQFAISEDDYIDYLMDRQVKEAMPNMLLAKLINPKSKLLFIGYNLRHWSQRAMLHNIWAEYLVRNRNPWTVIQEKRVDLIDGEIWKSYGVDDQELISVDFLEDFIAGLTERLAELPATSSPLQKNASTAELLTTPVKPPRDRIFISYSHKDSDYLNELKEMLYSFNIKDLNIWDDCMLKPGALWREEIQQAIASAKAAILLVSKDFINSEFIEKNELPPLLEAAKAEGLEILWIKVGFCSLDENKINDYHALYNEPPLKSLTAKKREEAFCEIAKKIKKSFTNAVAA